MKEKKFKDNILSPKDYKKKKSEDKQKNKKRKKK